MSSSDNLTLLLQRVRAGDKKAEDELLPKVYDDLRRLALQRSRVHHHRGSLEPTALVHELYIRLATGAPVDWKDRSHFFAVAARMMRRIVIDAARATLAQKRGGPDDVLTLDEELAGSGPSNDNLVALDEALTVLSGIDPRAARVVELRFFFGFTEREIARLLDIGITTAKRDWEFARAWLESRLGQPPRRQS